MRICSHCRRCYDDQVDFCTESDHPALSETRAGSREMIPGYRLDDLLESSLKGDLYRGCQIACGQRCRIRIVSPKKKSGHQFLREAKHAAALFHPNLVDVYEAGFLDSDRLYVVSAETDGQTLREYLNCVSVPPLLSTIELMDQTAETVHTLHMEGLLHRALTPDNIILANDAEGKTLIQLKDIDYGGVIERSIVGNKFLIDTALDAVRYFAPEQFGGGRTSVRSDVYSLGIILYEMLAGTPPFDASKASGVIEKHRHQKPKEIRVDNFDLRALLAHTLNQSLEKEPTKRHASAQAFARQLRHMEQLATHVSTPPPAISVPPIPEMPKVAVMAAAAVPVRSQAQKPRPEPDLVPTVALEPEQEDFVDNAYDPWASPQAFSPIEYRAEPVATRVPHVETVAATQLQPDEYLPKPRLDRASRLARIRLRKNRSKVSGLPGVVEPAAGTAEAPSEIDIVDKSSKIEHQIHGGELLPDLNDQITDNSQLETLPDHNGLTVIAWQPPENDIPSIDDVIEELAKENAEPLFKVEQCSLLSPSTDLRRLDDDEITAVTERKGLTVVKWQPPEDDIPSVEEVVEELAKENIEPFFNLDQRSNPKPVLSKSRKKRLTDGGEDIQFLPSVMRKSDERGSLDLSPGISILSGYGATQARFSIDYQTVVLGVGITGLVLLFLVGNSIFRQQYVNSPTPVAPTSIGSVFSSSEQPQILQSNTAKKPSKSLAKSKSDDPSTGENPSSASVVTESSPKSPAGAPTQEQVSKNQPPARNASKPSTISSTLVISTENGKVKSTVESPKRSVDQKSPVATNMVTGASRPRIAGNQPR